MSSSVTRVEAVSCAGLALLALVTVACGSAASNELFSTTSNGSSSGGTMAAAGGTSPAVAGSAGAGGAGAGSSPVSNAGSNSVAGSNAQAGAGGSTPIGPDVDPIDDMEDGDAAILQQRGRSGAWYGFNDNTGGTMSPIYFNAPAPPRESSTKCAYVQGGGFTGWGAAFGFDLSHPEGGVKQAYDISSASGIRFYAKGDTLVSLNLQFPNIDSDAAGGRCDESGGDNGCFAHFGKVVDIDYEWREFTVRWSELAQSGAGRKVPSFDAQQVYGVFFAISGNTQFGLWVDDVALVN